MTARFVLLYTRRGDLNIEVKDEWVNVDHIVEFQDGPPSPSGPPTVQLFLSTGELLIVHDERAHNLAHRIAELAKP